MADKLLKSIKFPTLPDRYVIGDSTLTEEGAAADAKAVGEALATKADTKGTYEDLIVGGAEQLMADGYETDKEPYLFRATGGSADVGNREYLDSIVGGTVGWNQLVNKKTETNAVTDTANALRLVLREYGSPYANYVAKKLSQAGNIRTVFKATGNSNGGVIFKHNGSTHDFFYWGDTTGNFNILANHVYLFSADVLGADITTIGGATVDNVMLFDLTAMFNPTIADYIYSLEQATAGAGVAWFRNYFPKDYYPYDPGTLRSVEGVSAHETVGFNQWDENNLTVGYRLGTSDGNPTVDANSICSADFIPCLQNTIYHLHCRNTSKSQYVYMFLYDAEHNFIDYWSFTAIGERNITTPSNAAYFKVSMYGYGTTYNHDICINLSDPSRNGEYEPYQKHTYPLDSSLTLRGVPKLVDGKLAFDGDIYPPSGEVQRRYGVVDLGTLNWEYDGSYSRFQAYPSLKQKTPANNDTVANIICAAYTSVTDNQTSSDNYNKSIGMSVAGRIDIRDTAYTDAAAFKTAMSGVYMVYEKATPTTETAEGYEHYQICDTSGTEEFVTDGIVPVGHETRYPHDLKKKIETAPDSPSADGTYLMKRSGGKNTYMALPSTPSANGAYVLTVTVSGGNASYSWTAKE